MKDFNSVVRQCLEFIRDADEQTLAEQLEMCQIPAPSYHEAQKALYVLDKFRAIGLDDAHIDEAGNVLGTIRGTGGGPSVMLAGHTDTVFPADTDLHVRKEGTRYICPGINDDTRAVAEIITIARAMKFCGLRAKGDIIFCANVCEEGLGDLKGIKHIFGNGPKPDAFVSIDDTDTGAIIYAATGSIRYKVTFTGCGGHSFGDFGIPNPIHAMGRAISRIADWNVNGTSNTTFNVGVIEGGTSVNTIAASCSMLIDMRSASPDELEELSRKLHEDVAYAVNTENERATKSGKKLNVNIEQIGLRPAANPPRESAIVSAAAEASRLAGITPLLKAYGSTDANIPMHLGIPAVTVGRGGNEGGVHTIDEWFEPVDAWLGEWRTLLLILKLAGAEDCNSTVIPN